MSGVLDREREQGPGVRSDCLICIGLSSSHENILELGRGEGCTSL